MRSQFLQQELISWTEASSTQLLQSISDLVVRTISHIDIAIIAFTIQIYDRYPVFPPTTFGMTAITKRIITTITHTSPKKNSQFWHKLGVRRLRVFTDARI